MNEKEIAYREGYAKGYQDAKKEERHGRWEWYADRCEDLFLGCDDDYGWRCSMCKVPLDDEDDPEVMPTFPYCPNCGAIMDLPNITEQTENALRKLGEHREEVDFDYNAED